MVSNYKARRPKPPGEALASAEQLLEHYPSALNRFWQTKQQLLQLKLYNGSGNVGRVL
jgi:hypothetical protein